MRALLAFTLVLGAAGAAACGDPCEKAAKRIPTCMGGPERREDRQARQAWVQICKKDFDRSEIEKCLAQDCRRFLECLARPRK